MAKDSLITGAINSAWMKNGGNSATNAGATDGEKGYAPRKGGRFPEKIRETAIGGRQLEKQTPPKSRKG